MTSGMLCHRFRGAHHHDLAALIAVIWTQINNPVAAADHIEIAAFHPHNSNPNPASAAALLKQELAATSAAGAFDVDSNGSDAFFAYQTPQELTELLIAAAEASPDVI